MNIEFESSFVRSFKKIDIKIIRDKVEALISVIENSNNIRDIPDLKKMSGYKAYYRIRVGDYRIGVRLVDSKTLRLIIIAHRKDIYDIFP